MAAQDFFSKFILAVSSPVKITPVSLFFEEPKKKAAKIKKPPPPSAQSKKKRNCLFDHALDFCDFGVVCGFAHGIEDCSWYGDKFMAYI